MLPAIAANESNAMKGDLSFSILKLSILRLEFNHSRLIIDQTIFSDQIFIIT
jgi:hypothetical protein